MDVGLNLVLRLKGISRIYLDVGHGELLGLLRYAVKLYR